MRDPFTSRLLNIDIIVNNRVSSTVAFFIFKEYNISVVRFFGLLQIFNFYFNNNNRIVSTVVLFIF